MVEPGCSLCELAVSKPSRACSGTGVGSVFSAAGGFDSAIRVSFACWLNRFPRMVPTQPFSGFSVAVEQSATVPARRQPARQRAVFVDECQSALDAFDQAGLDGQQQFVATLKT